MTCPVQSLLLQPRVQFQSQGHTAHPTTSEDSFCPSSWHTSARLPHTTRANAVSYPTCLYLCLANTHSPLCLPSSRQPSEEDSSVYSPAMLMKRCEKIDSWMGSSLVSTILGASAPTEMRISPVSVTSAWQPGSTRMVLGAGDTEELQEGWPQPPHSQRYQYSMPGDTPIMKPLQL